MCLHLFSMKNIFNIGLCLWMTGMVAQNQIDTSYTALGTFNKEKSKFPFIKMVQRADIKTVKQIENLVYKNKDSRALHLDAYFKSQKQLQPAVVLIHGGGWKSGNKSQMHDLAKEIAAKGYACFAVEYRLAAEAKYPAAVLDVKTAIQYIKSNAAKFNVDANKIAVLGCSSGAQLAALIGTTNNHPEFEERNDLKYNTTVHAIISMDGILAFHHTESAEGKVAAFWLDGSYEEKPQVWQQASALTHCDKNTPPTLFINSDIPRFHAGRDDMIAILNKLHIYSEVKTISNSPHSFWFFEPWFDEIVVYSTQFLDKVFKS